MIYYNSVYFFFIYVKQKLIFEGKELKFNYFQPCLCLIYEGCSLISALCLIIFIVSPLWQCVLCQMKVGSFSNRLITNTLIYYARLFGNIAV